MRETKSLLSYPERLADSLRDLNVATFIARPFYRQHAELYARNAPT